MKNWYAVITAQVLYDKNLKSSEKLLIAVINNLRNESGYCFASNKYLAELMGTSWRSVQRYLSTLEEKGYVSKVIELHPSGEVKNRFLTVNENKVTPIPNLSGGHTKTVTTPHTKTVMYNNKDILITKTNKSFVHFWNIYDKKIGKNKTEMFWLSLDESTQLFIIDYLAKYKKATPEKKYRKNPYKFLIDKTWNDEIIKEKSFAKKEKISAASIIQAKYGI